MSDHAQTSVCPEKVALRALLDGRLPAEQLAAVQAHADGCASCEAALKQMTVGGESWIGMAASLKERDEQTDGPLAAAMERLKTDDGSGDGDRDETDPQRTLDFLQPAEDPKLLGKLGQHEITEVIGWGGMGVVLKAYDPSLHRVVAVKVLASHLAYHAVARKRFIREAQAAAAVCHDNVVTIHAIEDGVADASRIGLPTRDASATLPKIIMQFVAGGSLQERIDQDGPLELKEVLRIAMQTAAGLAAAHAQGVVHRDVKPANILLENGVQRVKLTDFGLARVMDDASLTLSGVIAGTPQYMAPEQAWGRDVDARADLFSLGAVMYAMCSGHSPFRARTTMAVLKRVCEDAPRPLRAINPDVPDWFVAIIEKLLAKNPDERFQTATEVSELLGRWLAHVQQPMVVQRPNIAGKVPHLQGDAAAKSSSVRSAGRQVNDCQSPDPATLLAMVEFEKRPNELREQMKLWGIGLSVFAVLLIPAFGGFIVMATENAGQSPPSILMSGVVRIATVLGLIAAFQFAWKTSSRTVWLSVAFFLGGVSVVCVTRAIGYWQIEAKLFPHILESALAASVEAVIAIGLLISLFTKRIRNRDHESEVSPDRKPPDFSQTDKDEVDFPTTLSEGASDHRATHRQLPVKFLLLPLVVTWVLLGLFLALVIAETGTRNVASFLEFSVIQLLATFVLASVFRSAWNTSSWMVWIAALLFLPFSASLFGLGASYRDAPAVTGLICALQALTAVVYWLSLLFVRPLFVPRSDSQLAAQPFRWRRVLALSGVLLVPVMASVIWLKRTAEVNDRIDHESTRAATVKMPADPVIVPAGRDPRRPQIDDRGFPRGQLLSNNAPNLPIPKRAGNVSSSVGEPLDNESTDGLTPPARQGNVAAPSAVAESLKPLQGRWVVLTLQGDEPPEVVSPTGGGAGTMGSGMASAPMMRGSNSSVVTPTQSDQLRFLEFRNGVLFLNNEPQRQMMASIQNDRELNLTSPQTSNCDREFVAFASAHSERVRRRRR
ncbi:MAG: protein kinase [Planctomycetia bacterium]|nr:protein kinase [Planctomycetia bacterium]